MKNGATLWLVFLQPFCCTKFIYNHIQRDFQVSAGRGFFRKGYVTNLCNHKIVEHWNLVKFPFPVDKYDSRKLQS